MQCWTNWSTNTDMNNNKIVYSTHTEQNSYNYNLIPTFTFIFTNTLDVFILLWKACRGTAVECVTKKVSTGLCYTLRQMYLHCLIPTKL